MKTVKELKTLLAGEISNIKFGDHPKRLYEPINYILSLGGKRLRPILTLLAYQLKSKDLERAVVPAIAVEIFHNFTLMHDDIMDEAPMRRGSISVHEKWSQTVAILSGDAMLVKAYEMLLKVQPEVIPRVIQRFNEMAVGVCEGQQIDVDFEDQSDVNEQEYIEMIRLKTGVLIGFSLEFGGIMAGFDDNSVKLLCDMGQNMGIGFQLMDDYLDVYGEQSKFGKQVGGDIIANKKTYLLIHALQMADDVNKKTLNYWLGQNDFKPEEKVMAVKKVYDDIGIANLTKLKMSYFFNKSFSILDKIEVDPSGKKILKDFVNQIIHREN